MTNEIVKITMLLCVTAVSGHQFGSQYDRAEYKQGTKPYSFAYGIKDSYQGTDIERREISDGNAVIGSYSVQLPDGRKQTVKYKADHRTGFIADVSYNGEAKHPPPSQIAPFVVKVVNKKKSEKVHQSFQPNIQLFRPLREPNHLLHSQQAHGNEPPLESTEATEVAKSEDLHRYSLRRTPVSHQHKTEEREEQKYENDLDQDHTIRVQKSEISDDEDSTYRSSSSEDKSAKDNSAHDVEPKNIHSTHWRDSLQSKEAKTYFPQYTTPLISQPRKGLSTMLGRFPFNYDNEKIGHSLYPLRLQGDHLYPQILFQRRQLHRTIPYKRHLNKRGVTFIE